MDESLQFLLIKIITIFLPPTLVRYSALETEHETFNAVPASRNNILGMP